MIDKDLITRKEKLIIEDLKQLEVIINKGLANFLGDLGSKVMTERFLERIITRMIDTNYHILTETQNSPPVDYFRSFTNLAEIGVLPAEFARDIASSAGLRNRLVHEYDEIDPEKLFEAAKTALTSIPKYLGYINKYVG